MAHARPQRLSPAELAAERGVALPAKEVVSLLNLNVDLDVALDLAAPIDLAVAANAQAALPVNASVSANVLSFGSSSGAVANQDATIDQVLSGTARAVAPQTAVVDQADDGTTLQATELPDGTVQQAELTELTNALPSDLSGVTSDMVGAANALLADGLLNVDVNAAVDADIAAPIAGAVAANANVAAPINASVSANVLSIGSQSAAVAEQTAVINQVMDGVTAEAIADQDAQVIQ